MQTSDHSLWHCRAGACSGLLAALYTVEGDMANLHLTVFTNHDQIITWLMYRGDFVEGTYPLSEFGTGIASFLLHDIIGLLAFFALGVSPVTANFRSSPAFDIRCSHQWEIVSGVRASVLEGKCLASQSLCTNDIVSRWQISLRTRPLISAARRSLDSRAAGVSLSHSTAQSDIVELCN